jgi:hypothetical protein
LSPEDLIADEEDWTSIFDELGLGGQDRGIVKKLLRAQKVPKGAQVEPFTSERFAMILCSLLYEKGMEDDDDEDMQSSWTEQSFEAVLQNNLDLSRLFPFFGRESEVAELARLLVDFKRWWELDTADRMHSDAHKIPGFSFFVIGAASGIGKSTFARRAFQAIASRKPDSITDLQYESLMKLLDTCVNKRTLFRITYVEGLEDWERESTAKSIALRVLYQFCKRRTKQGLSYGKFADSFFGMALSLENVISYISEVTGSKMVVIHIDETNHLAAAGHVVYLTRVMQHLYSVMASKSCFVPCLFTGTNATFLISLKETSSFNVTSINLSPLEFGIMLSILTFVASQIGNANYVPQHIRMMLRQLIIEEGGNPQILRFQIHLMGELGKGLNDYSDSSQPSVPNIIPNVESALREPDRPVALPERTTSIMNYPGFSAFMASQSTELITALRENLRQTLISSYILSSVAKLQESPPLRRLLLGYALSGDIVVRGTPLKSAWTISLAEQAGFIYLDPVKAEPGTKRPADSATLFRVIFPLLFYGYFVNAVQPGDLLSIDVLCSRWHELSSREVEKLDIAALAFAFEWYFEKAESYKTNLSDLTKFKLRDVFPHIKNLPDITLKRPENFRKTSIRFTAEKKSFTTVATAFTKVATFTLGCGNDAFPDAWGHFQKENGKPFTIFIQSRKTTTGRSFTQYDLAQQLEYLQELTQDWILFVVTDGEIAMKVPVKYTCQVFAFDKSTQHLFYGPVLALIRKTLIQLEDETGVKPVVPMEQELIVQKKHKTKLALKENDEVNIDKDDY